MAAIRGVLGEVPIVAAELVRRRLRGLPALLPIHSLSVHTHSGHPLTVPSGGGPVCLCAWEGACSVRLKSLRKRRTGRRLRAARRRRCRCP
jgi:hypothetical protein